MPPQRPFTLTFWCCCWCVRVSWPNCAMADDTAPTFAISNPFLWPTADDPTNLRTRLRTEMADELLLMAIGRHASFGDALTHGSPADADDAEYAARDQRQHLQAATALHLLQRLRTMEAVDEKLTAAADETVASVAEYATAMQIFYEMVQRKVEYDSAMLAAFVDAGVEVRRWYLRLPPTRKRFAARRTVEVRNLLEQLGRQTAFVKKLAICSLFLDTARAWSEQQQQTQTQQMKQQYSKLANNVLKLAKNKKVAEHVERIFEMAVEETADEVADVRNEQKTREILFPKLVDKMRQDAILNSRWVQAKIH